MKSKNSFKIGDYVTAKTINDDGDTIFVSGEISSIGGDVAFLTMKFPKREHHSVKIKNIMLRNK
tara:strand:- start:8870 stop:9061 length:192 start_codon:yes stop_codon:yes gene_type:complete